MNITPLSFYDGLRIGTIDFISPNEVRAIIDIEAPSSLALNSGYPRPFPRINNYLLIPNEEGFLVGQVEWISIEKSQFPKRKEAQDFGVIDLPFPLRKMNLNLLGNIKYIPIKNNVSDEYKYSFIRGVSSFPTVGDPVIIPTQNQLKAIIESGGNRRVRIGVSPLAGNAEVCIDPDRLFGRHLAILGNTGSGKSCSVAGLIHWSLAAAEAHLDPSISENPNARFIILDPNGEYCSTFGEKARVFAVEPSRETIHQLVVPIWFWNSREWCVFTNASEKTQKPTLIQSLRSVKDGHIYSAPTPSNNMRRYLRTLVFAMQIAKKTGTPWRGFPVDKNFFETLKKWQEGILFDDSFSEKEIEALTALCNWIQQLIEARSGRYPNFTFSSPEIEELIKLTSIAHSEFGGSEDDIPIIDADVPIKFSEDQIIQSIEANAELMNVTEYTETMLIRIRTLLSDTKMKTIFGSGTEVSLSAWLEEYIGANEASNGSITVIDLSLVPTEVVHIITSVIARMTLEALQRYRKANNGKVLPTVLVMEEAHTFIKKYNASSENQQSTDICCQVFEQIAREGRKYGLGLVLSSQRPSELSPTVLSQCNSFLLHRISNDRDQELVGRLIPDNLQGLLKDLPTLPSRNAILVGWASELPVLVEMDYLKKTLRPKSDDPDFWDVWLGYDEAGNVINRKVEWDPISDEWQKKK